MNAPRTVPVAPLEDAQQLARLFGSGLALLDSALVPEDQRDEVYRNVLLMACSLIGALTAARDHERKLRGAA